MPFSSVDRLSLAIQGGDSFRPHHSYLKRHLSAAHRLLRPPLTELSVAIVSDKTMSELHSRYLGISGPTDVMTFPLDTDHRGRPICGEIVICGPEARRQCRKTGGKLRDELLLYALHGLLHLCGHDDRTDRDFQAMHRKEDRILSQIGVGPVFAVRINANAKTRRDQGARKRKLK